MQSTLRALVPKSVKDALRPYLQSYLDAVNRRREEEERIARRRDFAKSYYKAPLELIEAWVPRHTEDSNFYYDLTDLNRAHLAALTSMLTHASLAEIESVFLELDTDEALRTHFVKSAAELDFPKDIHFG